MTRRPGITLMEVTVAVAIMGLGSVAILTLFPLGASYTAQSVRDDRSYQMAVSIAGDMRAYWKAEVVEKNGGTEWFYQALDDPNSNNTVSPHGLTPATNDPISYPVVVDSMGWYAPRGPGTANPTASPYWLGDNPTNIPRRSLNQIDNKGALAPNLALRRFSLPDGLGFEDGRPTPDRDLVYNCLCIVQRRDNRNKLAADMTIAVFNRRQHLYAPAGVEERALGSFIPGSTQITILGDPSLPEVKPGQWVMDATCGAAGRPLIRHMNFYRVSSVTYQGAGAILEFETPIKPTSEPMATGNPNNMQPYSGILVVFRGISGVYPGRKLPAGTQ